MSITNKLNQIKNAIYGKEVRGAIHDAIKECYDDASVNHDNANMEVKMARGTHNTLNDRLDNVDEIQAQTNAQLSQKADDSEVVKKGKNYNTYVGAGNPFLEIVNPSSSASLHLTNSAGFSGPYIMGIGKDFEGTGVAMPNKANGHMISGRQYSSVTDGNWLWGSQESTDAAFIKLESNVVDAAPLIQVQTLTQATDSQQLIVIGDRVSTAGTVYANGKLQWNREMNIYDRDSNKTAFLSIERGVDINSRSHIRYNSRGIEFYTFTGTSGLWYPFRIASDANSLVFSGGDNTNTVGVATFNDLIKLQNNRIGFFGATPVAKPTNVATTVDAIHRALVQLGLIS